MFQKISTFAQQHIGMDGMLHAAISFLIAKFFSFFVLWWMAFLMALSFGLVKGIVYDGLLKKGTKEWKDFIMDSCGSIAGVI